MDAKLFNIDGIPCALWGEKSDSVIICVHGMCSSKTDIPIGMLAEKAKTINMQVLSFDLPRHGDRKDSSSACTPEVAVPELNTIVEYAKKNYTRIGLFACSFGAYLSLVFANSNYSYNKGVFDFALLLSPLTDMSALLDRAMAANGITPERLENERYIKVPGGTDLEYDYYTYVKSHPIEFWNAPTSILCGSVDDFVIQGDVNRFAQKFGCDVQILDGAEHYFHTPLQLETLNNWFENKLSPYES